MPCQSGSGFKKCKMGAMRIMTKEQKEIIKILKERAENPKKFGKKISKELQTRMDNFHNRVKVYNFYKGNI